MHYTNEFIFYFFSPFILTDSSHLLSTIAGIYFDRSDFETRKQFAFIGGCYPRVDFE